MKNVCLIAVLFLALAGCNFADYAPVDPDSVTGSPAIEEAGYKPVGIVHGESWSIGVLWFWTVNPGANLERAKQNMLDEARKYGADKVVDVQPLVLRQMYLWAPLIGQNEYHASGVAVKKK